MRSIIKSIFTILTVLVLTIGVTSAYFTDQESSETKVFTSGTIDIALNTVDSDATQLQPGGEISSEFSVQNTGTLPVYFKGYFSGEWSNPELPQEHISYLPLEEYRDGSWATVDGSTPLAIDEEFEYKDSAGNLMALNPGESKLFRTALSFSEDAGNEYQGESFNSELHFAARQTNDGAHWPSEY